MSHELLRNCFRVGLLLLIAASARAQDAARMDEIVRSFVDANQFMGTVLVAKDDKVLFSKAYGSANLEWKIPNDTTTKFRLGSITKQFTAASVLMLEERGKLKIDDPIKKYFPDSPAAWDKISIYHLLTHTSGVKNFTSLPDYASTKQFATTSEKSVARVRDLPLDFEPGSRMSYSNSGYLILGALVEKVSGMSYEKFVQENIFNPLAMKDSGHDSNAVVISHRAAGYTPGPNGIANADFIHMSVPHGAGALYSTTEDLLKWERGLFGGKIISAESLKKMTTPFKNDYALGVSVSTVEGRKLVQHGGGIEGFNTSLAYYPDSKVTVVALANLNGNAPDTIVRRLGVIAHGGTQQLPSERKEVSLPVETLKQFIGTYALRPNVNMTITLDGNQLVGQISGQRKLPIFPQSETLFFAKAVDAQLEFAKDANGKVTQLVLRQNGRDTSAPRTSEAVVERREIPLSAEALSAYVGSFELRSGLDVVFTVEGGQLMVQPTGQAKAPIFPESERKFFSKVIDAQFEFERTSDGGVTHVTLTQGPNTLRGAKK